MVAVEAGIRACTKETSTRTKVGKKMLGMKEEDKISNKYITKKF